MAAGDAARFYRAEGLDAPDGEALRPSNIRSKWVDGGAMIRG
jgi:hypothetical protein